MTAPETRWIRDVPSDPMMQRQWSQQAIPWCTTHDLKAFTDGSDACWLEEGLENNPRRCEISTGGPDHKWWKDS